MQKLNTDDTFDFHEQKHIMRESSKEEDIALIQYYDNLYVKPVKNIGKKYRDQMKEAAVEASKKKEEHKEKETASHTDHKADAKKKKTEHAKDEIKKKLKKHK